MIGSMLEDMSGSVVDRRCFEGQRTVGYDHGIVPFNSFICDRFGQIDCEKDRVHLATEGIEGRLEQHWREDNQGFMNKMNRRYTHGQYYPNSSPQAPQGIWRDQSLLAN